MEFVQIEVKERPAKGTSKVRALRRDGQVPAVLYGLQRATMPIVIRLDELNRFLRTGSRLVELRLEDKTRPAILREVQHDPVTDEILHVDFVRVDKDHEIEDFVPIIYKGRAKGTATGGIFQAVSNEIRVKCRPLDLPREIVYDITGLELGASIHGRDIPLPDAVKLLTPAEDLLAHVVAPKLEAAAAPAEGEAVAEPELIRKPAAAEEGEEAPAGKAEKADKPEKKEKKG